ncbi:MAG: 30S ribosomal protein S16 [Candidatus Magasanikbacteria bacterium]|nr:30S ribosomal protein S16 [Candidatus Magasanikbacteria bacterium]
MLAIRLQRRGKKKQPVYRVIVSEKHKDTQAGSLEILGHYNPLVKPSKIVLKVDRIKYWISVGAQPSNTVFNLLVKEGVIKGDKKKSVTITNKRQGKIDASNTEKIKKEADAKAKALEEKEAKKIAAETEKAEAKKVEAEKAKTEETPKEEEIKTEEIEKTPAVEDKAETPKTEEVIKEEKVETPEEDVKTEGVKTETVDKEVEKSK